MAGETDQEVLRMKAETKLDIYMQTPGIPLCEQDRDFIDPLAWGYR